MKLNEIEEQLEELNIDKKAIKAFLKLIDHKIENDMDKAVTRIEASIGALKSEFGSVKNETTFIKWLIGGVFAAITILLAIVAFKK